MELIYSFTVALFLTIALIPLSIRLAPMLGLMDNPGEARKMHVRAIPRSGGLAMAVGVALPIAFFVVLGKEQLFFFAACLLIAAFGLLDDRNNLHYRWKFFGQIIAVLMVMAGGLVLQRLPLLGMEQAPPWLSYPLTFIFILGVTNAVNLTDGLDGLAAGTTLLALTVIAVLALQTENEQTAFIALTVIGGVLGFLRYNTFPARVFMGDTGSQFLGFITACLSIQVTQAEISAISPVAPLLVLGLPVLDTLTVMCIRLSQGRSPFSPDRNHLHHQMIALGFRHNEAVAIIYLLQMLLLALAFVLRYESDLILLAVYGLFCATLLGSLWLGRRLRWRFRSEQETNSQLDRRNILLRRLDWFYHHSAHVLQVMIVLLWLAVPATAGVLSTETLRLGMLLLPVLVVALLCYRRLPNWTTRICVYGVSILFMYVLGVEPWPERWLQGINLYLGLIAIVLALAIRMTRREHFRLDTQDLLVLMLILVVPLLPFETLDHYAIGEIALRLAVLMYSCEFIIGKTQGQRLLPLNLAACLAVLCLFWHG